MTQSIGSNTSNSGRKGKVKVLLFAAVGIFNTIFNIVLFDLFLFTGLFNALWANFLSLVVSIVISYGMNKYWVFKDDKIFRGSQLISFMAGTFAIQLVVQHLAVWLLGETYAGPGQFAYTILHALRIDVTEKFVIFNTAKLLGVVVSVLMTYFFYDKYIFKKKLQSEEV